MPIQVVGQQAPLSAIQRVISSDGFLEVAIDTEWAGAILIVDSSTVKTKLGLSVDPTRVQVVRVVRGTETPIRGFDMTTLRLARAVGYDFEAPLGETVGWKVYFYDKADKKLGASTTVSLKILDPVGGPADPGLWIKHLTRPGLSCQVQINSWPDEDFTNQVELEEVWGARFPIGGYGVVGSMSAELRVLTHTVQERQRLKNLLLQGGVILLQPGSQFGHSQAYVIVEKFRVSTAVSKMSVPARITSLSVREVEAPSTLGSRMIIPRATYKSAGARQATYGARPYATYLDRLLVGEPE